MLNTIYDRSLESISKTKDRKKIGQFFTPTAVAKFMSSLFLINNMKQSVRLLDPGAGTGILTAAFCQKLLLDGVPLSLHIDLYENDETILPLLKSNLAFISNTMTSAGFTFSYEIIEENFLLLDSLFNSKNYPEYDFIISNPPYKKISISSPEANAFTEVISGQPNLYFLFMAQAAKLLKQDGEMVFITPRSFTSGNYFKKFRAWLLKFMIISHIHSFHSRSDTFSDEKILQEIVITKFIKTSKVPNNITVSFSDSGNMDYSEKIIQYSKVIRNDSLNKFIFIPRTEEHIKLLSDIFNWPNTLLSSGYILKTGPIVDFRSAQYITNINEDDTIPLFWPINIINNEISHPIFKKEKYYQYIKNSSKGIIENKDYIFIKRFSSKEESRRIVPAFYFSSKFSTPKIGIENHLNYLTKIDGDLCIDELYGLFTIFNTSFIDQYYRLLNGSTQVNAFEINSMPLPNYEVICQIGKLANTESKLSPDVCDKIVIEFLNLNKDVSLYMSKLDEAKAVLADLKIGSQQTNDRSAYTLLALLNLTENSAWSSAESKTIGIHKIIEFIKDNYGHTYAENSRESIRRQTIHQFEQFGLIERNADDPTRPTNSGNTVYSIVTEALHLFRTYKTSNWEKELANFLVENNSLAKKYANKRSVHKVPIIINGTLHNLSAGKHNDLQADIINEFAPRYAKGSELLYVGDTAKKSVYIDKDKLESIGIAITEHDKLPDIVLYDENKKWLYLCEAVTSHGPVSQKRYIELEEMLKNSDVYPIYVSCFPDRKTYLKFAADIAWETEVWLSDTPDHMVHYNGDKFLGPRK